MDVEIRDPASAWLYYLEEGLFGQVVTTDDALVGYEEDRFRWVEVCGLR